jgi:hypothetical protein
VAKRRGLSIARDLTNDRRKAIRGRLNDFGGLDGWRDAMEKLEASAFLCGQTGGSFRAELNWLIDPSPKATAKFRKLVEGGYGNGLHAVATGHAAADDIPEHVRAFEDALKATSGARR